LSLLGAETAVGAEKTSLDPAPLNGTLVLANRDPRRTYELRTLTLIKIELLFFFFLFFSIFPLTLRERKKEQKFL
jgi:hypothetical protein